MAVRTAVVGLGLRGRQWLAEVAQHPAFILAAGVDPSDAARAAADVPEGVRLAASLEAALEEGIDAAVVATPAEEHARDCQLLLENGVAVLVEKPFTPTLAEAARLVEFAEDRAVPLAVAQNYRYMRAWRTVADVIASGVLGELRLVAASYYRPPHELAPSLATAPQTVLWGMAIHHLDAIRHVTGLEARAVSASISSRPEPGAPRGATCSVLLDLEGGVQGTYSATYESSGHGYFEGGQEFYARFVGADGTLHVLHRWLVLCLAGRLPRIVPRGRRGGTEEAALLELLHGSIETGHEPEPSGRDNLLTMSLVEACVRSADERRWVDLEAVRDV